MTRRRLTPVDVRRKALARAGAHPETRIRSFALNSPEAHQALCWPREEPWIRNGSLPRAPRGWPRPVEADPGQSR